MKSFEQKVREKWRMRPWSKKEKEIMLGFPKGKLNLQLVYLAGYRAGLKQANPLGRLERLVIKTAIAWLLTDNSYNLRTAISKLQAARKKVKK